MRGLALVLLGVLILSSTAPAVSQAQFPQTDIYFVLMSRYGTGSLGATADAVINLTRRAGYDNQPFIHYADSNWCYYSSIREDGQADIWRMDMAWRSGWRSEPERVTATAEAEYSPRITPDSTGLTVVRVEADSSQRLVRMNLDGSNPTRLLADVEGLDKIGYYCWLDSTRVVLFVLGAPHSLWLADIRSGEKRKLADDIGRCVRPMPWVDANTISYVQKDNTESFACMLDVVTGKRTRIVAMPAVEVEDFEWMRFGKSVWLSYLLTAHEGQILYSDWSSQTGAGTPWAPWLDLRQHGLTNITRISALGRGGTAGLVLVAADSLAISK